MSWRIEELPEAPRNGDEVAIIYQDKPLCFVSEIFAAGHRIQCGGYACWQRSAYGTYKAIDTAGLVDRLFEIIGGCDAYITTERADAIDALGIAGWLTGREDDQLEGSCEAYIIGTYLGHEAVLCWENSD